jgi:transposase
MDRLDSRPQVSGMMTARKPYPSDVSDEEWALAVPYLTLLPETAGQRTHLLREAFDGLRYLVRHGIPWRAMPHDLPPWHADTPWRTELISVEKLWDDLCGGLKVSSNVARFKTRD